MIQEEWSKITIEEVRARITEMPDRCKRVVVYSEGKPVKSDFVVVIVKIRPFSCNFVFSADFRLVRELVHSLVHHQIAYVIMRYAIASDMQLWRIY